MDISTQNEMIRSARRMAVIMALGICVIVGVAVVFVAWRILAPQTLIAAVAPGAAPDEASLGGGQLTLLLGIGLINFGGWALILWWARSMFAALGQGRADVTVRAARRIAFGLWMMLVWQILMPALGSVIATWAVPQAQRSVAISLGVGHAGLLLSALIASAMAHALAFGGELWRDHKEIV